MKIQTSICVNAKRFFVYINGQVFPHSCFSLEAGTWIRTASLALSAKENYSIIHVYVCMSKKPQNVWKLKEKSSIMSFQKRAPEYILGKLLDSKNMRPFYIFNSRRRIDSNKSVNSKIWRKTYLKFMHFLFCFLTANLMIHLRYIWMFFILFILDTTGLQPLHTSSSSW